MKALVTGGLGFIGLALARRLSPRAERLVLFDAAGDPATAPEGADVVLGDIGARDEVSALVAGSDVVFHLASVVSAGGERDFDLALRVNLEGGLNVLEACRAAGGRRLVFTSTLAVFGGETSAGAVGDTTKATPETTYGTTKAICELLLNDYTRRGFLDGLTARLPTVIVRGGEPNEAASSFASAVFREPLAGRAYALPVGRDLRLPVIGVETVVACLEALADLPTDALGPDRALTLPSLSVTVGELVETLRLVGGEEAAARVSVEPQPAIEAITRTWPRHARSERADRLGLPRDASLEAIVREYAATLGSPA
ncbi:MAG: NAD-dependent epimerase/dehydratase family protein [Actinobacteria bacterium]|nr:NAD-dependent epimerase/dehydratase family protein [Actinomycetota bacterium]